MAFSLYVIFYVALVFYFFFLDIGDQSIRHQEGSVWFSLLQVLIVDVIILAVCWGAAYTYALSTEPTNRWSAWDIYLALSASSSYALYRRIRSFLRKGK